MDAPHRVIGTIADGIADAARGLVVSGASAVKGAGKKIMVGLDEPFTDITGKPGPHRIADRLADGAIDTWVHFVDSGIIGTAKMGGETIMSALDYLPEQIGLPSRLPRR